jgi:cystathionine beta-lyase
MPELAMGMPEGTYLAWLDCSRLGLAEKPAAFFLNNARVAVGGGEGFGKGGEGFIRLNFGCPRSMLVESLERMKLAIRGIK